MDAITLWLTKAALTRAANALLQGCVDSGVLSKCAKRAEEWRTQLPPDAVLHSVEMFFSSQSVYGINNLPTGPINVVSAIERGDVPSPQLWFDDLFAQWKWVRDNCEEPTEFFKLSDDVARAHLNTLADLLHRECAKDEQLFRVDTHKRLLAIDESMRGMRRPLSDLPGVDTRVPSQATAETVGGQTGSRFHSDLEAVCAHLKKGHPQLALAALESLENQHWHELSNHERYRLVANRGIAKMELGQRDAAARDFIACTQYEPNEEKPRCWGANGNLILGDRDECASMVQGILVDFPESTFAYALRVHSAPMDAAFPEVEGLIPQRHRNDPDVALALSERAAAGRLMETAEGHARVACKNDNAHPQAKCHLGSVIVESTIQRTRSLLSETPPVDEKRLDEGIAILKTALADFETRGDKTSQAWCHFHIGRAFHFLGDDDAAEAELKTAYTAVPSQPSFCTQYAIALQDNGRADEAIQVLENASAQDDTLNAAVMAGQLLLARRADGDIARAVAVLESAKPMFPGSFPSANTEYINVLCGTYSAAGRNQDAVSAAEELTSGFNEPERLASLAMVDRISGNRESAKSHIVKAVASLKSNSDVWTRHTIAVELILLDLYEDAFSVLRDHVTDKCMSLDTKNLIFAAQKCEQHGFLIDFLRQIRLAGVFEPQFVDLELGLLEQYQAGEICIEIIQGLLANNAGDQEYRLELRVRLSYFGLLYEKPELVETDMSRLPRADATTPDVGFLVTMLLVRQKQFEQARKYAYTLLRCNFHSKQAHQAIIGSYLLEQGSTAPREPATVTPGTAFYYVEDGVPAEKRALIEDEPSPNMEREEYPPTHHVFGNAIGKRANGRFTLKDNGFQKIEGTILKIQDKRVFRFNDCIHQYDQRFDDGFLVQIRMAKDASGDLDLDPIRIAAQRRAETIAARDKLYRTYPLSVASYAALSQTSIVDTVGHLANERLPIRCCVGTMDEEAAAIEVLQHEPRLVLDPSAVATLVHTNTGDLISSLPSKLIVPRGLLIRMKADIQDALLFSGSGAIAYVDSRLVYQEVSEEQKERWMRRLKDAVYALEACGSIVDGIPLAHESPANRNRWSELFGWETAQAIAIAKHQNAVLWTDDSLVSFIANQEAGIGRVWTEVVYKSASLRESISSDRFEAVVAELVRLGYWHTKLFPDAAVRMAVESEWDFRQEPFKSTIEWIGNAGVSGDAIRGLAEVLLPRVYGTQNEVVSSATIQVILGNIGRRRDGRSIILDLRRRVGFYCGLNFVIERRLTQDFDTWLSVGDKVGLV